MSIVLGIAKTCVDWVWVAFIVDWSVLTGVVGKFLKRFHVSFSLFAIVWRGKGFRRPRDEKETRRGHGFCTGKLFSTSIRYCMASITFSHNSFLCIQYFFPPKFEDSFIIQSRLLQVAMQSFELVAASKNHEEIMVAEPLRIPFLKLALQLATELGQPRKAYERELSELR